MRSINVKQCAYTCSPYLAIMAGLGCLFLGISLIIFQTAPTSFSFIVITFGALLLILGIRLMDRQMRQSIHQIVQAFSNIDTHAPSALAPHPLVPEDSLGKINRLINDIQQNTAPYQLIFGASPDGILLVNKELEIVLANTACEGIFGYTPEELQGQSVDILIPAHQRGAHRHVATQFLGHPVTKHMGYRPILEAINKDKQTVPVEITLTPLPAPNTDKIAVMVRDARQRSEYQNRIQHLLNYDTLTELPNRRLFEDRLKQAIVRADKQKQQVHLIMLGIDGFKTINDVLGHAIGDHALTTLGKRLLTHLEDHRTVARIGGDEFAVIAEELPSPHIIPVLLERIQTAINTPLQIEGHTIKLTACLGVSTYPEDADEAAGLMKNADIALMQAKQNGRGKLNFYNPEISPDIKDQLEIDNHLRHALGKSECKVHYQPIVDLATTKIVAAEALLRWHNPTLGQVPPDRFIPIAESNGMIHDLDRWTRRMAFSHAQYWAQDGKQITISVNISAVDFEQTSLAYDIIQLVRQSELSPSAVSLEITESMLMKDPAHASDALQQLRNQGIQVAIDDFGTGYSCLAHLQKFPVNRLKIDREFVKNMQDDNNARKIVEAIISLAHTLEMEVVAEGIETEAQRELLLGMGCKLGQGYLFSTPLSAEDFTNLIGRQHEATAQAL